MLRNRRKEAGRQPTHRRGGFVAQMQDAFGGAVSPKLIKV
jgi:hypothetical protein